MYVNGHKNGLYLTEIYQIINKDNQNLNEDRNYSKRSVTLYSDGYKISEQDINYKCFNFYLD